MHDHGLRRRGALAVACWLALATPALATTYYVNPGGSCNDGNAGLQPNTAWCTIPGTRNTANTDYLRSAWGSINGTTTKLACGDTILIKGGPSVGTSTLLSKDLPLGAGGLCIANASATSYSCTCIGAVPCAAWKTFYPTGCNYISDNTDVDIRIATNAEWDAFCPISGSCGTSLGNFTINCNGMTPRGNYFTGAQQSSDACVDIHVEGSRFHGISATQRIEIENVNVSSPGTRFGVQVAGAGLSNVELGYLNVHNINGAGIGIATVNNVVTHDSELHDNASPGFNCGLQNNNFCNNSALINSVLYGNGSAITTGFFNDQIYLQGGFPRFVVYGNVVHDGFTSGANSGNAAHVYDVQNVGLFENNVFYHNGLTDISASAQANVQGGGDGFPDESLAPAQGYCNSVSGSTPDVGKVCTSSNGSTCACSRYDSYTTYIRNIFLGAFRPNIYVHHGSGFSIYLDNTMAHGAQRGTGQFQDQVIAGDHTLANMAIIGGRSVTFARSGIGSGGIQSVCRQNCPNAGKPCGGTSGNPTSICLPCINTAAVPACGGYRPLPTVVHSIIYGDGNPSQTISDFRFTCDVSCSNSGTSCRDDSDCTGCGAAGGCNFCSPESGGASCTVSSSTYANASTLMAWLTGPTNQVGVDPRFVNATAPNCVNGTDPGACDFRLASNSTGIDAGTFAMLADGNSGGGGSPVASTHLLVKANPLLNSRGTINFNRRLERPRTFFRPPDAWPSYTGTPRIPSTIQIKGAVCDDVTPKLGSPDDTMIEDGTYNAERAVVAALSADSASFPQEITLDRSCTWSVNAGISLPWAGNAPNIGASQVNLGTVPSTTSTSTSTSSSSTATSTTTSSTVAGPGPPSIVIDGGIISGGSVGATP